MDFVVFALAFAGFGGIAMSTERHAKQVFGRVQKPGRRRLLALLGWFVLIVSIVPELIVRGASIGSLTWFGLLTLVVLLIGCMLTYRPRPLRLIVPAMLIYAILSGGVLTLLAA